MQQRKLNILIFSDIKQKYGGYEIEVAAISNLFVELGHKVFFITPTPIPTDGVTKKKLNKKITVLNMSKLWKLNFIFNLYYFMLFLKHWNSKKVLSSSKIKPFIENNYINNRLLRIIENTDLVYLIGTPKNVMSNFLVIAKKTKVTIVYHEISHLEDFFVTNNNFSNFFNNSYYCDYVIGCSIAKNLQIQKFFSLKNTPIKIEQWAYFNEEDFLKIEINNLKNRQLNIGILSRIYYDKGIIETLLVIERLLNSGYDLKLKIAGDGILFEEVNAIVKKSNLLNLSVELLGFIDPSETRDFFSGIEVLIQPSLAEGGPINALEGMAAGKIIISSDVGSMKERLINKINGFLFPPGDWFVLEKYLIEVYEMPINERMKISLNARSTYLDKFSKNIAMKKFSNFFELF